MSRELSRRRRPEARGSALLSDLARLPLEAAVDMVCASLDTLPQLPGGGVIGAGATGGGRGHLPELVARIEGISHGEGPRAAAAAARVLGAGARVGGLGGGAAELVARLAAVALRDGDEGVLLRLTAALFAEPTQFGVALQGPLIQRCRADARARAAVLEATALWRAHSDRSWREHGGADAVDGLTSALVEQAVARRDLDQACAMARLWPPMRTALTRLGAALAGEGRIDDLAALAAPYDRRSGLFIALMERVVSVAVSRGARGEPTLRWVFALQPTEATFSQLRAAATDRWPTTRAGLIQIALNEGLPPWLIPALAEEEDAKEALSALLRSHGHRPDVAQAAQAALTLHDPHGAFEAACRALLTALQAQTSGRSAHTEPAPELTRHAAALEVAAAALGQPALAGAWLALARRELSS